MNEFEREYELLSELLLNEQVKDRVNEVLDKIRAEIVEYKDDKIIHAERNEMIDIVLDVIDKYKAESEHIGDKD